MSNWAYRGLGRDYYVECNRIPEVAAVRNEQAAMYRRLRNTDPELARLLWRRVKNAYKIMSTQLVDNLYV